MLLADPPQEQVQGAVYTPRALAAFLVGRALEGGPPTGRWLDPACGDGALLEACVERLAERHRPEALAEEVLNTLVGVDIDPAACRQAAHRVRRAVERHTGRLPADYFADNVRCGDFLAIYRELDQVAVVCANPPYVSAAALSAARKQQLGRSFRTAWGRLDLYCLFMEAGVEVLAPGGVMAYLTPDKYLSATSARPLRQWLRSRCHTRTVDRFERHDLFPGVATVPAVTVLQRPDGPGEELDAGRQQWWDVEPGGTPVPRGPAVDLIASSDGAAWTSKRPRPPQRRLPTVAVGELVKRVSAGMATGLNSCLVIDASTQHLHELEAEWLRPAVRGRDIQAGSFTESGLKLIFPYEPGVDGRYQPIDLQRAPRLASYLLEHREALERRHCVRVWRKPWYALHDPVSSDLASIPKILLPDLARSSRFAHDRGSVVPLHSAYYLELIEQPALDAELMARMLNTPTVERDLLARAPIAKSAYRRFRAQYVKDVRLPVIGVDEQRELAALDAAALDQRVAELLGR